MFVCKLDCIISTYHVAIVEQGVQKMIKTAQCIIDNLKAFIRFLCLFSQRMVSAMLLLAPVFLLITVFNHNCQTFATFTLIGKGSHQKKKVKKLHNKCELWGGGQQNLVCEPQKSAFFKANFPKKHAEINSLCPIFLSIQITIT